jgi:predicted ATPase
LQTKHETGMATLTVKNVGPIREAEFEVKKYTVFIGPQGSGKSTLAKLVSILSSRKKEAQNTHVEHNIQGYISNESSATFNSSQFSSKLTNNLFEYSIGDSTTGLPLRSHSQQTTDGGFSDSDIAKLDLKEIIKNWEVSKPNFGEVPNKEAMLNALYKQLLFIDQINTAWHDSGELHELYIPSERMLIALLSKSLWGLINSDVSFPRVILAFASGFEQARNALPVMELPFLKVAYKHQDGDDILSHSSGSLSLSQSASGFQSIIPLLLVVEHQRQTAKRRFIIEEPELNLYPTAQKDLIYNLVSGLDPEKTYQDAEWVFTTHSPYVLSSLNTLMLAYKVGHQSDENRAKVEAIIRARHWINPDDFAAYYVNGGTVRSMVSDSTGLISESELDDVSEDFAGEQDQLLDLYRSLLHA